MDNNNYKFVNSVDPSKCRAKIKEKFSKLTLSSNKKIQEKSEMPQDQDIRFREEIVDRRISRNLLSELLTEDESDEESGGQDRKINCSSGNGNLLMRTDSSSSLENIESGNRHVNALNATDATHCSEIEKEVEKSLEMEPLMVSFLQNTQQLEEEIEILSSRVSSLAMTVPPPALPLTISSEHNPQDVSRIVSTENQRMASAGQVVSQPVRLRAELKQEPDVSICISSSYDDDLREESDSPITISDSSDDDEESEQEEERAPAQHQEDETELNVSSIVVAPSSSQNMTMVKANQMAAFLRDVRKNYGLPTDSPDRDFERRQREIATADTEPMTVENDSRSAGTARRIATADTESMTDPTTIKDPSPDSNRRLALDDTEDMTRADESLRSSRHYNPVMKVASELLDESVHRSSDPIPDDSLTIAETSDEEEPPPPSSPSPPPAPSQPTSQSCDTSNVAELKRSETLSQIRSRSKSTNSSMSSADTQVQINISAKINIKIQVSHQQDDSNSSELTDSFQSNDKSTSQSIVEEPQPHNGSSAQKGNNNQSRAIEDIPHSPPERDIPENENVPETPSADYMDKAQQLLNELYGDQWMTPQVMRSLKKVTLDSTKKKTATPKGAKKTPTKARVQQEHQQQRPSVQMIDDEPDVLKSRSTKVPEPQNSKLEVTKSNPEPTDESVLADFSIFRRNIPQDLDSTRLPPQPKFKAPKPSRRQQKPTAQEPKSGKVNDVTTKTRSGREVRQNWRKIVDSDTESEADNASDDSERFWEKSVDKSEELENKEPPRNRRQRLPNKKKQDAISRLKNDDEVIYLDLSKDEVEIDHNVSTSPKANNDEVFKNRLQEILKSCKYEDKPKINTPNSKSKRKLFSALVNEDLDNIVAPFDSPKERAQAQAITIDEENVSISGARMPAKFEPFNKYLESVKTGKPIFKIQTPKAKPIDIESSASPKTPASKSSKKELREIVEISKTPRDKYGFLRSLDLCVGKSNCHPDALYYRDNFRLKKEELATRLYEIYNTKCFNDTLNVPLVWNKKLTNTAGRCMNKKRLGDRTCVIELSEKVLTSADRLRCTLIHELCHAATWILNGESGHGATWKAWARKANYIFPELPKIGVCHQYDIEYKYTYKCVLCGAKSHAHSKSKKVENIRCSYCHGAIEVYLNKKDKEGNAILTPVKEPTGFAKFVKDKYKQFKRPDLKHADVMKLLSNEFASMKVDGKS
ncbi:germ cell nuclear acidic protein-like [Eupeodes corollae]|uniref:germ cell nuclear acidic protein-like n=1 Tax=Eupeodes corollae TaxID=290404 RepID=UPI002490ECBB|nr:germ cell nuclear acidic protein-like [Eupeodes corollae]